MQEESEVYGIGTYYERRSAYLNSIKQVPYTRTEPKIGRNKECPCGSGVKYKKCCGY